ncbi:MAG: hypothetical protein KDH96_03315 [Candidatus Riesia sp.]|nr:hypothetical protein [Candidatus Riesia sp.]
MKIFSSKRFDFIVFEMTAIGKGFYWNAGPLVSFLEIKGPFNTPIAAYADAMGRDLTLKDILKVHGA